jgi:hypothetical protein
VRAIVVGLAIALTACRAQGEAATTGRLERADEVGRLAAADRPILAARLRARAVARLAIGDPGAEADLDRAAALAPRKRPRKALRADAAFLVAAAELARAGGFGEAAARDAAARGARWAPGDPRRAIGAPDGASAADLAAAAAYLEARGAKRAARELAVAADRAGAGPDNAARRARLAWWWSGEGAAPPAVAAAPVAAVAIDGLDAIEAAWRRAPAEADRLVARQLARDVLATPRAIALVDRWIALGDPARAERAATAALEASPRWWRAHLAGFRAAVAVGAAPRADLALTEAAARSGDPGPVLAEGAAWFLEQGEALAAIGAARRAILTTPRGQRAAAYATLAAAQDAIGRTDQAAATRAEAAAEAAR